MFDLHRSGETKKGAPRRAPRGRTLSGAPVSVVPQAVEKSPLHRSSLPVFDPECPKLRPFGPLQSDDCEATKKGRPMGESAARIVLMPNDWGACWTFCHLPTRESTVSSWRRCTGHSVQLSFDA
jgi:hypothetical protein